MDLSRGENQEKKNEIGEEFEKILAERRDPLAIARKMLYKVREEILKDKDFIL